MKYPMKLNMKIKLALLFLIFPFLLAFAQPAEEKIPLEEELPQKVEKDYSPYPVPAPGYVTDLAGIITEKDMQFLNYVIYHTEKKSGVEIAVVTINSLKDYPGGGNTIEEFATGLFNKYGIGNMPKNDGVLLLVSMKERKARIELGAEYGRTRDKDAQKIMDNIIIRNFKKGNFSTGVKKGTTAIAREFAHVRVTFPWSLVIIPIIIIALIFVAVSLFRNGKKGWGWVVVGIIFILIILLLKIIGRLGRMMGEAGSGTGTPGGFGGGFGGGFSGGGGATGGW